MQKECFVIMPFSGISGICSSEDWTTIFTNVIKPAVESTGLGYTCRRSVPIHGNIISAIVNDLANANVVIADLTGQNANVFYELGVRHSLQGRSILLAQKETDIPSDLRSYAYHIYDWQTDDGKNKLHSRIKKLLNILDSEQLRTDNPVGDFLQKSPHQEIFWLARHKVGSLQQMAKDRIIDQCVKDLNLINNGQIPVTEGSPGYFKYFLDRVRECGSRECVKAFVPLINFEPGGTFEKFSLRGLYEELDNLVHSGKLLLDYIFLLQSKESHSNPSVELFLARYIKFSRSIRIVYVDSTRLSATQTQKGIALLTTQETAFTHDRDREGNHLNAIHWINQYDFNHLSGLYNSIELDSSCYFTKHT